MARITKRDLEGRVWWLRRITGVNYQIELAYGKPRLVMMTPKHTISDVSPRQPAGQLYDWISAYIQGIEDVDPKRLTRFQRDYPAPEDDPQPNPRSKSCNKPARIYEDETYSLVFDFYGESTAGLPFFPGEIWDIEETEGGAYVWVVAGRAGMYLKDTLRQLLKDDNVGDAITVVERSSRDIIADDWDDVRTLLKKRVLKGERP